MDLRRALLLTLAATPLTGCYLHCNNIPEEGYSITAPVSREELDRLVRIYEVGTHDDLPCERVCDFVYERDRGWQSDRVGACELTPPEFGTNGQPPTEGSITCDGRGIEFYCKGRRPLGHVELRAAEDGDGLARTLAEFAHLEAASVLAFDQLAAQLLGLGAPATLVERCRSAAADERDHARWLGALAEGQGARLVEPRVEAHAADRFSIALHNAVEGCVHEAFAALVAAVIASVGTDPVLRRIYARIAEDETRHGQLAWDLHAWLMDRLSSPERERVAAAQRAALAGLPERVGWLAELPVEFGGVPPRLAAQLASNFVDAVRSASPP